MSISRFHVDANPVTTNVASGELTFVVYRELFYGAASVRYTITAGTATEGTDYDDSLDSYTGTLTFADKEVWKEVRLQVLGAGTGTVICTLSRPVGGQIITPQAVGTINTAGTVRYYAASAAGAEDGSSPDDPLAFSIANLETFISTKQAGRTALLKRGDSYTLSGQARITRGEGGTAANPMILGAYGAGANPVLVVSDTNDYIGVVRATSSDADTGFIIRDLHFQPSQNSGDQCGAPLRAVDNPSPSGANEGYEGWRAERCTWSNPNNYAGFDDGITASTDSCPNATFTFNTLTDIGNDERIPYDGKTGNFTAGLIVTGGSSGATATIIEVLDNGDGTGTLRVATLDNTAWQNNEAITDSSTGAATVNIPTPTATGGNPNQIILSGGNGFLIDINDGHTYLGNSFTGIGPKGTDRSWAIYTEGSNITIRANKNDSRQGFKVRGCEVGSIIYNYSKATNGAQNLNLNYYDSITNFNDVDLYGNVLEGQAGVVFQEADGTDATTNDWGFHRVRFFNNVILVNVDHLYSKTLSYCLSFASFNITGVTVNHNTLAYTANYDGTPLAFSGGTIKDEKFEFKGNLVKVTSASISTYAITRSNTASGEHNFVGDYNIWDYASGSLHKEGATTYADLAAWQAAESTELNSIEASVTLSNPSGITGLEIVPDAGGNADGAGLTGLVAYDFRNRLRPSAPTIGAWELNDAAIRGTFGGFF